MGVGKRLFFWLVLVCPLLCHGRVFATPFPPTLPDNTQIGEIIAHIPGEARAVTVQGNVAYMGFDNELKIIDVTNKEQPVVLSQLTVSDIIWDIAVQDGIAYVVNSAGIEMVDVTTLENPHWLGVYAEESARQLYLDESYIYLLTWYGLRILDASDAPNLIPVSAMDIESARDLDVLEEYAFVLGESSSRYYLYVINLSDLTNLEIERAYEGVRGQKIYVTKTKILAVGDLCSSTCGTYLAVVDLDWQTLDIAARGFHRTIYHSVGTQAVETNKMYAFAGKDIGLWVYNYFQDVETGMLLLIDIFHVGRVWQIEPTDDYIYTASTTEYYEYLQETKEGGFYILPAPPLFNSYLPVMVR